MDKNNKHYNLPHHHHLIKGKCVYLDCPLVDKPKIKKVDDFRGYLQDRFMDEEPQILDDDLPDAFEEWVVGMQVEELIDHADVFAMQTSNKK